jgi:PadR family transcriptional regulator PadR
MLYILVMSNIEEIENSKVQMRKGFLEFCVLLIISNGEIYPSDILSKLKESDLLVVEGTLYPLLSRLNGEKMLEYSWKESRGGPPRKYYRLTETGRSMLKQLVKHWQSLSQSINKLIEKYE